MPLTWIAADLDEFVTSLDVPYAFFVIASPPPSESSLEIVLGMPKAIGIVDLEGDLHDYWVDLSSVAAVAGQASLSGWFQGRGGDPKSGRIGRFRFELVVTHATLERLSDPQSMDGFMVSAARLTDRELVIEGDGPPGEVAFALEEQSVVTLIRQAVPFARRRWLVWRHESE